MSQSVNFDRATEYYDATRGFPPEVIGRIGPFVARAIQAQPDMKLLEIGIGTGRIALPVAPHVGYLFGADISTGMMRVLQKKRADERIALTQADALHLPYRRHSFDAALVVHVLHLVSDPVRVLDELRRVLKPGATLALAHNRYTNPERMQVISDAWQAATNATLSRSYWHNPTALVTEHGWHKADEEELVYDVVTTPGEFLERIEKRLWSSTWVLPEETLQQGIASIRHAIETHFAGDADTQLVTQSAFSIALYHAT